MDWGEHLAEAACCDGCFDSLLSLGVLPCGRITWRKRYCFWKKLLTCKSLLIRKYLEPE